MAKDQVPEGDKRMSYGDVLGEQQSRQKDEWI